jgi:PhnB protein
VAVKPIPDGYPRISPYLYIDGAAAAIDFYTNVLGATERLRFGGPDGKVGHCELEFGDSIVMVADEWDEGDAKSPKTYGGSPVCICLYVDDVDAAFKKAVDAGAKVKQDLETKFYGDRTGMFEDPWGHIWNLQSHVEEVSADEMQRRMAQMSG